jgi:hypothetical protein
MPTVTLEPEVPGLTCSDREAAGAEFGDPAHQRLNNAVAVYSASQPRRERAELLDPLDGLDRPPGHLIAIEVREAGGTAANWR